MAARIDLPRGLRELSVGSLVLAVAVPLTFLHASFQPHVSIDMAGTSVDAYLSDLAVLAVVVTATVALVRDGAAPLREGRLLWVAMAAFFVWLGFEILWGRHQASSYPLSTHAVTGLKFFEYALLAPAVALLVRTLLDLLVLLWSLALWSCAATIVGIAQFFGADIAAAGTVGHRQASFLSSADFAALSAATLIVGFVAVAAPRLPRSLAVVAVVSGTLGMIVAGAMASVLGLATALFALALVLLVRRELNVRRVVTVGAIALVVAGGVVAIRGRDLSAFARFVGTSSEQQAPETKVQTYAHRTLLAWIGFEIWKDHPLLGVGWEGSTEPADFEPYLPAAHDRFPDEPVLAFPARAPERHYGVQNVWLQSLADLGVIGFALWAFVFGAATWLAVRARASVTGLIALGWIGVLVWLWSAQGFVAGIPLDSLTWLAFGLAATRLRTE